MRSKLESCLCLVLLPCLSLCSCAAPRVDRPLTQSARNDAASSLDFWHALPTRPLACNDEAFHALLLWFDGADRAADYAQRVGILKSRGWLEKDFNRPGEEVVRRGTLAMAIAAALELKGGLTMRILGSSPRYALRELEYRQLMPPGSTGQAITGEELVGLIARAQEYRETNRLEDLPPAGSAPDDRAAMVRPILAMLGAPAATRRTEGCTVVKIEGDAQYRADEESEWQLLRPEHCNQLALLPSASVRTGSRARVTLRFWPDQEVVIDQLTCAQICDAARQQNRAKVNIGMNYGRVLIDVWELLSEHQLNVRGPSATLAVRGTRVVFSDRRPFPPHAMSLTGRAEFAAARKQAIAFGSKRGGTAVITADAANPAEVALRSAVVDPTLSSARTPEEARFVQTILSQGAVFTPNADSGIPIVRGGVPPTGAKLLSSLPGELNFVVTWTGNANLDLAVSSQSGDFIMPVAGYNRSPSGGRTAFDHQGGPHGGIEVVYWPRAAGLDGDYTVGIHSVSGADATATVQVYRLGTRLAPAIPGEPETRTVQRGRDVVVGPYNVSYSPPSVYPSNRSSTRGR